MSALSIEIDATQLFVRGFIIPGVSSGFHDSHQIQTLDLVPGSYAFQVQSGVISDIRFTVTPEGMVAYDESLDRCVSGRGTKRLTVEGFEVTLDAQSLSGAGHGGGVLLASVQSTNDDWISRKTCRLVPQSGFMVQQGSGQVCNLSFAVTLDGAFSYDAKHDRAQGGCLSGHGTPSLTFHGFPVNVDATAVSKTLAIVHQIWGGQPSYTGRTRVVVLPATFFTLGLAPAVVTSLGFNVDIHGEVTPLPSTSEGRVVVELLGGEPLVRILPTTLIGSLRVTPVKASPGEAVLIEALGADGHPADPASPIMINGVRGTRRYLQYPDPGTYNAIALAKAGDAIQSASAQIVVEAAAWPEIAAAEGTALLKVPAEVRRLPLLSAAAVLNRRAPYHIEIAAADTAEFQANLARTLKRSPAAALQLTDALSVKAYHWDFGDGAEVTTASGIVDHDFSASLSVEEEHRLFEVTCTIETAGAQRFEVKRTLSVVNAYAFCRNRGVVAPPVVEASHARKVFAAYEASITVHNPESSVLTLTSQRISYEREDGEVMGAVETLAVPFILAPNAITTLNLSIPFVQVPADAVGINVMFLGRDGGNRAIHVETYLDVALPDHRSSGLIRNGFAFTRMAAVGFDKLLTAAESTNSTEAVPIWKQGFHAVHLAAAAFASESSTSFITKDFSNAFTTIKDKPGVADVLFHSANATQAIQGTLRIDDQVGMSLRTLRDAAKQMQLEVTAPQEGDPCDPDNLPESIPDGFACQISQKNGQDELITWHRHAGYANARKGNIVLAPGGPAGFIGGLLRQVSPPQHYGHCGIMTRNYDMITHSTFSEERLLDHPNGRIHIPGIVDEPAPTDGHDPDVLKYGWPGTVTQWVKGAVGPEGKLADLGHMPAPGDPEIEIPATEPVSGKAYAISPFNRYAEANYNGGDWEVVPPLVVKPDPFEETPEVRARLHALANAALADTGRSHYRFFCYTDASIGVNKVAPQEAPEWARGTYPSVCSSFIWVLLNRAGIRMESPNKMAVGTDLEPKDRAAGAEVGDRSLDGLYLYRGDERKVAAQWLHDELQNKVSKEVKARVKAAVAKAGIDLTDELAGLSGGLIKLFSDIGDDVANQMVNTFAADDSSIDAKDSDAWKDVADSRAISPDNTLFWDPPSVGGLYGYVVPAAFIPERTEQAPRYTWKFVPTHGALEGVLKVAGKPQSRGLVQITDLFTAHTDNNGRYSLPKVPFGFYTAKAQWDQGDGIIISGSQRFEMKEIQQRLDFDLQRPAELYRTMHVSGDTYFMKYYVAEKNPRQSFPYDFSVDLAPEPGRDTARWMVRQDFHGIYGAAAFLFILGADGTVKWNVAWAVSQDARLIEDIANSLSSAIETISLGFISNLFGNEVNGADSRSGDIARNGAPAHDGVRIGPGDRTTGLLNFRIENRGL